MRFAGVLTCVVASVLGAGCTRDAADALCPDITEGDLVVTEIAGPQTGNDVFNPYVELYNASGATIDLYGVRVRFRRMDGSGETPIIVRRNLPAAPGSYTALGLDDDADLDGYLDYGFASDFQTGWLSSAAIDVEACGTRIDRATYSSLPNMGSYSLGAMPPTEEANDLPASWCTDATVSVAGVPGSPQQANVACP